MINNSNIFAHKKFSQHFLHDKKVINKIVAIISPKPDDDNILIEIGSGLGALTQPISEYVRNLTAIEIDRNLIINFLKNNESLTKKLTIYQQNVLTFNFTEFSHKKRKMLRVFGNLPYNISTSLLFHLFDHIKVIKDMHFLLQKEFVDRIIAVPGCKDYGRFSVISQYYCRPSFIFEILPKSFQPKPKVKSALIRLIPHDIMPNKVKNVNDLNRITNIAFSQRRKMLRNSMKNLFSSEFLEQIGIFPTLRAENISVALYCQLANLMNGLTSHSTNSFSPFN
ncbi:MAG: 16S rRNA (adenine(1518)-N(6)/adenine(1519)-N(6))-dimethyltransferase RsmA [Candidatus Dasytiphilus stammeri]